MRQMLEKILGCYGRVLEIRSADQVYEVRAFLQPVTGRGENMIRIDNSPIGREEEGQYVYIGPVDPAAREGDLILDEDSVYVLRRCETVDALGGSAYRWGMCIRKGGEDTWGHSG